MAPLLELRDLKKSYRSPDGELQPVVDVPAFQLEAERELAIAGASGSGKTTFLNLIAVILRPDSGSVKFDGEELTKLSGPKRDAYRARHLGYVFQTFNLLGGYTEVACYGLPVGELPSEVLRGTRLTSDEIGLLVDYVMSLR